MIPSVEERKFRPCESCHCYWEAECGHDGIGCSINGPRTEKNPHGHYHDGTEYRNYNFKRGGDKNPCPYHITKDEYREAAESGAFNLRPLVYVPPPLDDYDGTIRFKDADEDSYVICFDDTIFYMLDPEYDHSNLDKEIAGAV